MQAPGPDPLSLFKTLRDRGVDPCTAFTAGPPPPSFGLNCGEESSVDPTDAAAVIDLYQDALSAYLRINDGRFFEQPGAPEGEFGWNEVRLFQDDATISADINYLPQGTVSGLTVDGNGVQTGADVRIKSIVPDNTGLPKYKELNRATTDPATGEFSFSGVAQFDLATFQTTGIRTGNYALEAANPFSPTIINFSGQLNTTTPNQSGIVLQFPATTETNGTMSGIVLLPDGITPAPENTSVLIESADGQFNDLTVTTDAEGKFDSPLPIPGDKAYLITATDPAGGLTGRASAQVPAAGHIDVEVKLLGLGTVVTMVQRADGSPVSDSKVVLTRRSFPGDTAEGVTDSSGLVNFVNLTEGIFDVIAEEDATSLKGRTSGVVVRDNEIAVIATIAASGVVMGSFVEADAITPIPDAQVVISTIDAVPTVNAFTTTNEAGRFEVEAIPIGSFAASARDFVSGRVGQSNGRILAEGDTQEVTIIQQPRGTVSGVVLQANGFDTVPGATVSINSGPAFSSTHLQVSARSDGSFNFEGVAAGEFTIRARDPATKFEGTVSGLLQFEGEEVLQDVLLEPFSEVLVTVLDSDGAPVGNAELKLEGPIDLSGTVDADGQFLFEFLKLGTYKITASSLTAGEEHNGGVALVELTEGGLRQSAEVQFGGVGNVTINVVASDGVTPVSSAEVNINARASFDEDSPSDFSTAFVGFTDGAGQVSFTGVPVGELFATGEFAALAGLSIGTLVTPGQSTELTVQLGESGRIEGRVLLTDGVTPAANTFVTLEFETESSLQ
jgi:hypothetical protein